MPTQPYLNLQDYYNLQMQDYLAGQYMDQSRRDMEIGARRGQEVYSDGSLGRLDASRDPYMAAIMSQYQQGADQGFGAPIYAANLNRYMADVNRGAQTGLQQANVQAANQGVRGAVASNLNRDNARQAYLAREQGAQAARMDDLNFRNQQRSAYGNALQYNLDRERQAETYNQAQKAKELQGQQAYEFGYGSLGAASRGGAQKYVAGQQQVQAAGQAPSGGK